MVVGDHDGRRARGPGGSLTAGRPPRSCLLSGALAHVQRAAERVGVPAHAPQTEARAGVARVESTTVVAHPQPPLIGVLEHDLDGDRTGVLDRVGDRLAGDVHQRVEGRLVGLRCPPELRRRRSSAARFQAAARTPSSHRLHDRLAVLDSQASHHVTRARERPFSRRDDDARLRAPRLDRPRAFERSPARTPDPASRGRERRRLSGGAPAPGRPPRPGSDDDPAGAPTRARASKSTDRALSKRLERHRPTGLCPS